MFLHLGVPSIHRGSMHERMALLAVGYMGGVLLKYLSRLSWNRVLEYLMGPVHLASHEQD